MVKIKYPALYTDNLGCEQAEMYFSKYGLELKVRNCIFKNKDLNFDFYSNDSENIKNLFHLKDNELVKYFIDIKIPLVITYNNKEFIKEFLLRIERNENHYNNSLSLLLNDRVYEVEGYDLQELIKKMKNKIPKEYDLVDSFSLLLEVYHMKTIKEKDFYYLKNFNEELNKSLRKEHYFSSMERKNNFDVHQSITIDYILSEYCSS